MVATALQPIDLVRGRPWRVPVQWRSPDGGGIDLSGFTVEGSLRWNGNVVPLDTGNGGVVVTDAANGRWDYRIADTGTTAQVPEGTLSTLAIDVTDGEGFVVASGFVPVKGVTL
jgi:hypothetical protein